IIVVACKRRKSKEEREEIKARKEEERQRREEERQMQREKLEAERELAKAKQEAELEKIRAQAGLAAGAGMAGVAMQQPSPQPQAQPQMQSQTIDNNALARIEAEIAQINLKIANQQYAQPQFMPVPMQQQMQPQFIPVQQQMPFIPMQSNGVGTGGEFSELRADVRSMREEQRSDREVAALKKEMELEFAKMRSDGMYGKSAMQTALPANIVSGQELSQNGQPVQANSAEVMGAIMAAFVKNMSSNSYVLPTAEPAQEQQSEAQTSIANASANYPSNAVITTTTTVDTTKNGSVRNKEADDGRLFDIDGFYDTFDGNK
ncbi:MAG: hypothetical protein K2J83_04255, partial [Clostridia bacterium]|nr:hypothetical protein [Clostridia bacterium]